MSTVKEKEAAAPDLPSEALRTVEEYLEVMERLRDKYNVIEPFTGAGALLPLHKIALAVITIDPTVDEKGNGPECYRDRRFCGDDEVALGKVALMALRNAAAAVPVMRKRLDDRSEMNYWEIEFTLALRNIDGTVRSVTRAKEMDMRDGSPETLKPEWKKENNKNVKTGNMVPLDPSALSDKRRHGQSRAETLAEERCIRDLLKLRQKYTVAELKRPWIVPRLVPDLDANHPMDRQVLLGIAGGVTGLLYGTAPAQLGAGELRALPAPPASRALLTTGEVVDRETGEVLREPPPARPPVEDLSDLGEPVSPAPEPEYPTHECGCPCGDLTVLSDQLASYTEEKLGVKRCRSCFPWNAQYKLAAHQGLKNLELPKFQGMDGQKAGLAYKEWAKSEAAKPRGTGAR
ncbi:MAG TPA: hypothetical protein VFG76_07965 [Candidatus Polarisedimenticolia bacterium]|nr:hypothetical protein [Candidatus Polarisedimenticolia bacterium]